MDDVFERTTMGESMASPNNRSMISGGDNQYNGKNSLNKQASLDSESKQKRSMSTLPKSNMSPYQTKNPIFG